MGCMDLTEADVKTLRYDRCQKETEHDKSGGNSNYLHTISD